MLRPAFRFLFPASLLLVVACGPTGSNETSYEDVTVDIISPLDGSQHDGDLPISFEASALHENGDDADYIVAIWIDSDEGALEPTDLSFERTLMPGGHSLSLTVYFADGSSAGDEVFIRVNGLVGGTYTGSVEGSGSVLGTPSPCTGTISLDVNDSGSVSGDLSCDADFLGTPFPLTWSVSGSIVDEQLSGTATASDGLSEPLTLSGSMSAGEIVGSASGPTTSLTFVATL